MNFEKHFPNHDPEYIKELFDGLISGDNSKLFKYLVDKTLDLSLAFELAIKFVTENNMEVSDLLLAARS